MQLKKIQFLLEVYNQPLFSSNSLLFLFSFFGLRMQKHKQLEVWFKKKIVCNSRKLSQTKSLFIPCKKMLILVYNVFKGYITQIHPSCMKQMNLQKLLNFTLFVYLQPNFLLSFSCKIEQQIHGNNTMSVGCYDL